MLIHVLAFIAGLAVVAGTLYSAIETFVLPRSSRNLLTRVVFRLLRKVFNFLLHFGMAADRTVELVCHLTLQTHTTRQ